MSQPPSRALRVAGPGGPVAMRLYESPGARAGVLAVGGVSGGFDSPARGLYERLARALPAEGLALLRVRFRHPGDLDEGVDDILLGLEVLARQGAERIGLVGHSFGGAVVIRAAVRDRRAVAVCTLATQGRGAEEVALLAPRPLLVLHGTLDEVLPTASSSALARAAGDNAQLVFLEHCGHVFDEGANEVSRLVIKWALEHVRGACGPHPTSSG